MIGNDRVAGSFENMIIITYMPDTAEELCNEVCNDPAPNRWCH